MIDCAREENGPDRTSQLTYRQILAKWNMGGNEGPRICHLWHVTGEGKRVEVQRSCPRQSKRQRQRQRQGRNIHPSPFLSSPSLHLYSSLSFSSSPITPFSAAFFTSTNYLRTFFFLKKQGSAILPHTTSPIRPFADKDTNAQSKQLHKKKLLCPSFHNKPPSATLLHHTLNALQETSL